MDKLRGGPRSCSVHQRHKHGPLGNEDVFKVRLSNLIARNCATFLELLHRQGRTFFVVLEQPASSWLFKMEYYLALGALLMCVRVTTWKLGDFRFYH